MSNSQAYLLQSIPNASITTPTTTQHGTLAVECVMYNRQGVDGVFLVLRLNSFEKAIDNSQLVTVAVKQGERIYTFMGNSVEHAGLVVCLGSTSEKRDHLEDVEMFEGLLSEHADFRGSLQVPSSGASSSRATTPPPRHPHGDLQGHLLIVDQSNGAVVGEVNNQFKVQSPEKGHEGEPIVIDLPQSAIQEDDALTLFIRDIPPDESHWMTSSAAMVSGAITTGTNLIIKGVTTASTYYIAHANPSPHRDTLGPPSLRRAASSPSINSYDTAQTTQTAGISKTAKPSAALVFLSSESTRKGLSGVHAVSGKAVQVSGKTVQVIDGLIRKAVGRKEKVCKPDKRSQTLAPAGHSSQQGMPPGYQNQQGPFGYHNEKGGVPGRSPSPHPPPLPPRSLTTKDRVLLSADLILTTIDQSAKKMLDVGGTSISKAVGHKYGEQAGANTLLFTNSARNLVLVYVDVKGVGRNAILKSAGKHFVKAKISSNKNETLQPPPQHGSRPNLRAETAGPSYQAPSLGRSTTAPGGFNTSPGGYHSSPGQSGPGGQGHGDYEDKKNY